jgi:hypothetical protein
VQSRACWTPFLDAISEAGRGIFFGAAVDILG